MTCRSSCLRSAVVALALGLGASSASAEPASADNAVEAIWRVYEVAFTFSSPKSYYACTALRDKIRTILRGVGAHPTIKVMIGCDERVFLSNALVTLVVAMPEEATPEAVEAATTFTSKDELAARVRGESLPTPADIERFPAAWQRVSLSDRGPLFLSPGDCDLLSDLNRQVFPKLGIRAAERFSCFASATRVKSVLQVEALMPIEDSITADAVP
jgi:hypothetical protein